MDANPLCNTTNSPPLLPALYKEEYGKQTANLWSSEESYRSSLTEIKDDIYNAERLASDEQTVDDTDIIYPSSPRPQTHPLIPTEQDDPSSKQGDNATPNAPESVAAATEGQNAQKSYRSEKMLRKRGNALQYSEPPPIHSRSSSIDCHLRSYKSLDCLESGYDSFIAPKSRLGRCSSPWEEACALIACTFLFPLSPCHPPVARQSTPPGLPAFGSREAQELRLTLASQSKLANIGRKLLRYINADDPPPRPRGGNGSLVPTAAHPQHTNVPADMLKRMLGITRPVPLPVGSYEPGRSKLPKGVKIAAATGALIQADDGTFVRGRWGPRTSGHGIGQRTIGVHPFAQLRESSAINEAVREIDKAHGREQDRARRALPGDLPVAPSQSEASNAHMRIPKGRTVSIPLLRTSTMSNALSMRRPAQSGHTSMPLQSSYQMNEPDYHPTQTRPDQASGPMRTGNSPEGEGNRNTGGVVENQVAASLFQICWEWTCRPCNQFFFPDVVSESSRIRDTS